jgi:hypothetical protein
LTHRCTLSWLSTKTPWLIDDCMDIIDEAVIKLLSTLNRKGVQLSLDGDALIFKAPKGALSADDAASLKRLKDRIVAVLRLTNSQTSGSASSRSSPAAEVNEAPLTFPQQSEWTSHRLAELCSYRSMFAALRIGGPLDIRALERAIDALVRRHSGLRTRIVVRGGLPKQIVDPAQDIQLDLVDVIDRSVSGLDAALQPIVEALILRPVSFAEGPLFDAKVVRIHELEHVLIVVMDHMISDGYSLNLVLNEVLSAYSRCLNGLPPFESSRVPGSAEYAVELARLQKPLWEQNGDYWMSRLLDCGRTRFPGTKPGRIARTSRWAQTPVRLSRDTRAGLMRWSRVHKASLVTGAFTAFVALILRWCDRTDTVVRFQVNNRDRPEFANTVGFLASRLHLRIHCHPGDTFLDLLKRVRCEYYAALERNDLGYLETLHPAPEFTRNAIFSWTPATTGTVSSERARHTGSLELQTIAIDNPAVEKLRWDNEPVLLLYEMGDEVSGSLLFPSDQHSMPEMEKFAANFPVFVRYLIDDPSSPVMSAPLPHRPEAALS